ncbi:hypothetical protein ONZ43_g3361 [Nemania bipapillata]|uniref:Uncharacterized protein n=1 Tax=Nemania bipapillata TaxID=110536 RepID=A0ACC2IXA2_9PEZI|nr:hypothetical protein ONZ43_g3361 [Nemania bipapillata]
MSLSRQSVKREQKLSTDHYSQERHSAVAAANPGVPHSKISTLIAKEWANLPLEVKDRYNERADQLALEYLRQNPNANYKPDVVKIARRRAEREERRRRLRRAMPEVPPALPQTPAVEEIKPDNGDGDDFDFNDSEFFDCDKFFAEIAEDDP